MSELAKQHRIYFESDAGKELLQSLQVQITAMHQKAENSPELARDFAQRAKGIREALDIISSMIAERKPM